MIRTYQIQVITFLIIYYHLHTSKFLTDQPRKLCFNKR